ncbi:MAG: hypothetical protein ABGY75_23070, partial [Gemmataceae bacterium]
MSTPTFLRGRTYENIHTNEKGSCALSTVLEAAARPRPPAAFESLPAAGLASTAAKRGALSIATFVQQ